MGQCLCLQARVIEPMVEPVELPWELEEDILSRLPPRSLVRFKTVCKRWNALFNNMSFLTNHLSRSRPQFIIQTNSKIYSIDIISPNSIDPTIELLELPSSDIPYEDTMIYTSITTCDEFLFCKYQFWKNGTALWNPWLRQVKWMEYEHYEDRTFYISGLGYDNSRQEKVYKVLGSFLWRDERDGQLRLRVAIYESGSHTFTFIDTAEEAKRPNVSLNGNLYWLTSTLENSAGEYFIRSFDFSMENFKIFSPLPCQNNHLCDKFILAVYKGDRFSLLKQCYVTWKIDIWVTKKNTDRVEEEVKWIKLMTFPTSNLQRLCWKFNRISYFIYEKTLFICYENPVACIYIVRENMCKKIQIGSGIVNCSHCVYIPNLIPLPLFRG